MASMLVYSEVKRLYASLQEIVGRRRKRQLQISDPFDFKKEVTIIPGLTEDEITVLREKTAASRLGIAHAHSNPHLSTHHHHNHHHSHHPHHSHHSLPTRVRPRRFTTAATAPTTPTSLSTPNYFFTQSHDDIALLPSSSTGCINTGAIITFNSDAAFGSNNSNSSPRSPQSPDSQLSPLTILPLSSLSAPPTPAPPSIFSAPRSPPPSSSFVHSPPASPSPVVITLSGTPGMGGGINGNGNGNGDGDEGGYGAGGESWGVRIGSDSGGYHNHDTGNGNGFLAVPLLSPPPLSPPPRVSMSMSMGFPAALSSPSPSPSPPPVPRMGSTGEHRMYAFHGAGLRPPSPAKGGGEMMVDTGLDEGRRTPVSMSMSMSMDDETDDDTDPLIPGVNPGLRGGCVSTSPMGGGREVGLAVATFDVSPVEEGDYVGVDWESGTGFDAGSPVSTLSCVGVN